MNDVHEMSDYRRRLFLRIWAGFEPVHEVTARLYYLDVHFPEKRLDAALAWLVRNGMTGKSFVEFYKGQCGGSNLELHRFLLSKLDGEKQKQIFAGRDFRVN